MKIKIVGTLIAIVGVFALSGIASASSADKSASTTVEALQPASVQIINDELQVLGTARAYSVRIGSQGFGGVTFFNGTIINETKDEDSGAEIPVTFGDDVRIDGRVWRGKIAGAGLNDNREFKVDDDMIVTGDLTVGNLLGTGIVNSTNILNGTVATADLADDSVTSAKISNGAVATEDLANNAINSAKIDDGTITGSDISSSADLSVNTITSTGDITAHGDINQDLADHGAVKAMVYVPAGGDCTANDSRQWTYDGSTITCSSGAGHTYTVNFGFDINDRFWQATPSMLPSDDNVTQVQTGPGINNRQIGIVTYEEDGNGGNAGFMLTVY